MRTKSAKQREGVSPSGTKNGALTALGITMTKKIMIVRGSIGGEGTVTRRAADTGRRGDIDGETMTMSVTVREDIENDQHLLVTARGVHENTNDLLTVDAIDALLIPYLRLVPVHGHPNLRNAGSTGLEIVRPAAAESDIKPLHFHLVRKITPKRSKIGLRKEHIQRRIMCPMMIQIHWTISLALYRPV